MKKLFIITVILLLSSFSMPKSTSHDISEAINTLEDMIEWMESDVENGDIDQELGELYISNMHNVHNRISKLNLSKIKES